MKTFSSVSYYFYSLRIDSSNFDPVVFWACGMQLVALNYQTEDAAMAVNAAMFESTGCVGYVRKPKVMWDPSHIMYRRLVENIYIDYLKENKAKKK